MSRRYYSDAPINLIARIPSPEQISAARAVPPTFRERLKESGASFLRRLAELGDRVKGLGRARRAEESRPHCEPVTPTDAELLQDLESVEVPDLPCNPVLARVQPVAAPTPVVASPSTPVALPDAPLPLAFTASEPVESVEPAEQAASVEEIRMMRTELLVQRQELARLSAHVHELQALVASQQQVLMYVGQELEQLHVPVVAAAAPPKKPRASRAKSTTAAGAGSRRAAQKPMLNL